VTFLRGTSISGWRRITRRPVLAWSGACAAVLAAAAGGAVAAASGGAPAAAAPHQPAHYEARYEAAARQQTPTRAASRPSTLSLPAAQAVPSPVVAIGAFTGQRPSEIDFSADGGNIVTGIRWLSWTAHGATGQGRSGIESCVPNCAQGSVRYVPTTITLSDPVNGRFTVLGETRDGQVTTVRWPAQWPLGAR
jgi:hypothetical protein